MSNKFILGGGIAGLIAAYYLKDHYIIDENPLGQLTLPFIPGIRVIKYDSYAEKFIKEIGIPCILTQLVVGYSNNGVDVLDNIDLSYKKKYNKLVRDTEVIEGSILSGSESRYIVFDNLPEDMSNIKGEEFYYRVFKKLKKKLEKERRIIKEMITHIDLKNQQIETNSKVYHYVDCISTLNLKIFLKLTELEKTSRDNWINIHPIYKHFTQCAYTNDFDKELSKTYSYIYCTNGVYSRKTYFKDYVVYETIDPVSNLADSVDGNLILNKIQYLPINIQKSLNINEIQGIKMAGRLAQMEHKIKSNELIKKFSNESR